MSIIATTNTIDLYGNQLGSTDSYFELESGDTLTIKDTSGNQRGVAYINGDGGILNVESGTVHVKGSFAQINVTGGTVVDDTTVNISCPGQNTNDAALIVNGANASVTLDAGGTIRGNNDSTAGSAIYVNAGTLSISNGYTITTGNAAAETGSPIVKVTGGTTTIDGCTIAPYVDNNRTDRNMAVSVTGGTTTITGTTITSYHTYNNTTTGLVESNAALVDGGTLNLNTGTILHAHSESGVKLNDKGTLNIGGATINAYGKYGVNVAPVGDADACVFNMTAGTINVDTTDDPGFVVYDGYCYGVYVAKNPTTGGTIHGIVTISGGMIDVEANSLPNGGAHAYGVYNKDGKTQISGDTDIDVTAAANGSYVYGVYSDDASSEVLIGGEATIDVAGANQNISNGRYYGIFNNGGKVTMTEGTVTVGRIEGTTTAVQNTSFTYGVSATAAAETYMDGGDMAVYALNAIGYYINDPGALAKVYMRGGTLTVSGNNSYGVKNDNGVFEMGVHEQDALGAGRGATYTAVNKNSGYPYIDIKNHQVTYGVYSDGEDSIIKLFAGEINANGGTTRAIYINSGNVQVLTNEHAAAISPVDVTTFIATAKGGDSVAFYAASAEPEPAEPDNGFWAIRGRGAVFTGQTWAFVANRDTYTDGGLWHDPTCAGNTSGNAAPISGGTYIGGMKVTDPEDTLKNLILPENHYARDASVGYNGLAAAESYWDPTDGWCDGEFRMIDMNVQATTERVTIVDAEWELRHAMELDNSADRFPDDYKMPINILLDYADELHGTGPTDGDVDVDEGAHILDVNGKTLTYGGPDNTTTTEPTAVVPSVIEVSGGELTTIDTATDKGFIQCTNNAVDTAGIHVTGGFYYNGSFMYNDDDELIITGPYGAVVKGSAAGNALRVSAGVAGLFSGTVGDGSSTVAVLVHGTAANSAAGVEDNAANLNVYGGLIEGNTTSGIGILVVSHPSTQNSDTHSIVDVYGGTIRADNNDYGRPAIYTDGGTTTVATEYAHTIGTVKVEDGLFDLEDGTYMVGEGEEAKLSPSTIYAIDVFDVAACQKTSPYAGFFGIMD